MSPWRTAIVKADATNIWLRGYDIASLMEHATFPAVVFLLQRGRLPTTAEQQLLDALLIAVSDHGAGAPSCAASRLAASGNRQSLSAAVAAGILTIGDGHGGAGAACMEMVAEIVMRARRDAVSIDAAAGAVVDEARLAGRRIPGLGHRVHTTDPRVDILFSMARRTDLAGDGVAVLLALEAAAKTRIKPLPINIDGALAAALYDLGFEPSAGMLLFIVGRVAGLAAEVAEEISREKIMRIRIPVEYDGVPPRPID